MTGRDLVLRWLAPVVGAGLAIGILLWLYRDLDFERFVAELMTADMGWIVLLAVAILAEQWLRSWKWRQILHALKPISSTRLFGAILAGYGATMLIPLGISPLVRSWLVARQEGLRMASVLVTAAIERFIDGIVFGLIAVAVALTSRIAEIGGDARAGFAIAGALNIALFVGALWLIFRGKTILDRTDSRTGRLIDWLAAKGGRRFAALRPALAAGIVWPHQRWRQTAVIALSIVMKTVSATNFLWSGLAVGVLLAPVDYLVLLIFAGFALVIARFVRVPGGFIIGAGYALHLLGVPDEQALAMILFNAMVAMILMVGLGLIVLWRSGLRIRALAPPAPDHPDWRV